MAFDSRLRGARLEMFCLDLDPAQPPAEWPTLLPELVARTGRRPDLIFLQGARAFDAGGDEVLYAVGRRLGRLGLCTYRSFLSTSPESVREQVIYVNSERVEPVRHWRGLGPRHGFLEAVVDFDEHRPVLFKSVDLEHPDAEVRRLQSAAEEGGRAVLAGRFPRDVLDSLLTDGWHDQHTVGARPVVEEPVVERCVTTPGGVLLARVELVDLADTGYDRYRLLSGILFFLDEEDLRPSPCGAADDR